MNRDQIRGASRHLKGRAQTAIGGLAGDPARQVRGAVNQVAGGAQYAYGRARDRAEDFAEDGRHLAHEVRERADALIDDGRHYAEAARHRVTTHGRRAVAMPTPTARRRCSPSWAWPSRWLARPFLPLTSGDPDDRKLFTALVLPRVIAFITRRVTGRAATPPRRGH